jgi:hypothetical protein
MVLTVLRSGSGYTRPSIAPDEHVGREKMDRKGQRQVASRKYILRSHVSC